MPAIQVNGVKLNYEERGRGKPVILAIPGFGGSARTNLTSLAPLADSFRVVALDIRGHGRSVDVTQDWTIEQIVDDIHQFAKQMGIDRYVALGGSMGGAIVLRLAMEHPEVVEKLVLVSSVPACGSTTPKEIIEQALAFAGNREANMMMTRSLFVRPITKRIEDELDDFAKDAMAVKDEVKKTWMLEEQYFNWESDLKDVRMPTLVIHGDKDTICNPEAQHRMTTMLPNAKEVIVPETGHVMLIEAPDVVAREIEIFIRE